MCPVTLHSCPKFNMHLLQSLLKIQTEMNFNQSESFWHCLGKKRAKRHLSLHLLFNTALCIHLL